jgi:hypothetical protein
LPAQLLTPRRDLGPIAAAIGIEPALWVASALLMGSIRSLLAIRDVRELASCAP